MRAQDREVVGLDDRARRLAGEDRAQRLRIGRRQPVHRQRATLDGQISRNAQ